MTKQKGFAQESEDEAVRLARTSGRTRRELAENLGVGLSTPARWIARNRDREIDAPGKATKCLVPRCAGVIYAKLQREGLWDKFYMDAPARQRQYVEHCNIVKRA